MALHGSVHPTSTSMRGLQLLHTEGGIQGLSWARLMPTSPKRSPCVWWSL